MNAIPHTPFPFPPFRSVFSSLLIASLISALFGLPALAEPVFRSADLATTARIVEEGPDGTVLLATIENLGPQTSFYPLLAVHAGEATIISHDGDPLPQGTSDGVVCETTAHTVQCSYGSLPMGQQVQLRVRVKVARPTKAVVVTRAQQTPDPNPVANNRVELPLQPAHATVHTDGATQPGEPTAAREGVTWTIQHSDGRPAPIHLRITPDRPTNLYVPACPITLNAANQPEDTNPPAQPGTLPTPWRAGTQKGSHPGPSPEGSAVLASPSQPWTCTITAMKPGDIHQVQLMVERPKPGQSPVTVQLDAKADLPQAQMVRTTITVGPREGVPGQLQRLFGAERAETAANISQQRFPQGDAQAIILARGDEPADALTGAPLAVIKRAPVLLTGSDGIPPVTALEIERLGGKGLPIILLGGPAAINPQVEERLRKAGHRVTRLAGPTRTETAAMVAAQIGTGPRLVADGFSPDDVVIAAATMAAQGGAVLLTAGDVVPATVRQDVAQANAAVGQRAGRATGLTTYAATTPADTALLVAKAYFPNPKEVIVARAGLPADALAGGALAGERRAPLIVLDAKNPPSSVLEWVNAMPITKLTVLGGPQAISDQIAAQLTQAMVR